MLPNHQVRAELSNPNEQDRTVEVTWSTGSKGLRSGWDGNYYEELSMDPKHVDMSRLESGAAPVLAVHDAQNLDAVIGVVERAWLDKGNGKALLRFSASDPNADKTFKKIQERILRNVSVGYSVSEYTDMSAKGDEVPTLLATRWQPKEISIVPIGFDMKATTRSESQTEVTIIGAAEGSDMKTKEELAAEALALAAEQTRIADEAAAVKLAKDAADLATREAKKEGAAQERTRVSEITRAVKAAKLEDVITEDFITRGVSVEDAAKEILKKLEEQTALGQQRSHVKIEVTRDEADVKKEGMENYLLSRTDKKIQLNDNGKRFVGMSMIRMAEEFVPRTLGMSDVQLATRALTTSDFPNILANIAEKSMRAAYLQQAQSFKPWVKPGSLKNYKKANRLMLGDFPKLEGVDEHGEFKNGSMSESKETIQLARYGKSIVMTKEMLINDDLGAFEGFSAQAARSAAQLESDLVYTSTLLANPTMGDSIALFHASHSNLAVSGTAITVAALDAGWQAIANQKSLDGLYIDLMPSYLICGTAKRTEAAQIMSQNFLATQQSNTNPFAGKLEIIVDPRITGNQWYMAASPNQIDTIELATLESEGAPIVTSERAPNGNFKISVEHSVGAAALDYRGLYKNPGN